MDNLKPLKTNNLYYFSEFQVDAEKRCLWYGDELVPLTPKEFDVLFYLVERGREVASKNDLLDAIWQDSFVEEATLARNVSWLRKKLAKYVADEKFIETVPKRGYRFVGDVAKSNKHENILTIEEQTIEVTRHEETIIVADESFVTDIPQPTELALPAPKSKNRYLVLAVTALGLIVLAGTGFTIYQRFNGKKEVNAVLLKRIVSITGESAFEDDPKFSPDGKKIVYSMKPLDGGSRNIYVRQINVGDSLKITDSKENNRYPTFSPDGSHIGFLREFKDYGELITVPSLGGKERVIRRLFTGNYSISYSPINDEIAVIDTEDSKVGGQYVVYLVNTQTFERRRLTAPGNFEGETTPRFSPDGKNIAFVRLWDYKQDLFVVPSSGGEPKRLTYDNEVINSLSWGPDGQEIFFVSYRKGHKPKMWRVSAAGGERKLISTGSENVVNMAVSPNGKTLAFSEYRTKGSVYRLKPDGQPAQEFITSNGADAVYEYSRDGSRILFTSTRMRTIDVWTANSEGKDQRRVTDSLVHVSYPVFSPDGSQIMVRGQRKGKRLAFKVSAQGGELVEFRREGHKVRDARFGVRGEWIYFDSNKTGEYQIWKTKSDGSGEPIQLTRNGVLFAQPSLDGKTIYFVKSFSGSIWRISTEGGVEEEIKVISDEGFKSVTTGIPDLTPVHWKVTDKGIYFLIRNPDKSFEMKFYDFATEKVVGAVESDKMPQNITNMFATDGTNFLFNVKEKVSNIMLADISE